MKVLKIYDKLNRKTVQIDGPLISIKEYSDNNNYINLLINTNLFSSKNEKISYFSYEKIVDGVCRESIDITSKYLQYYQLNEKGQFIHSKRIHVKDPKSFLEKNRIYDTEDKFIEIENYKGNKTLTYEIKNQIITNLLKQN